MSEWDKCKLGEIAEIIDSLHQTPKYSLDGYPMVRVTDIKKGYLNLKNTFKVDETVFNLFSKNHMPRKGDILFSRVGSYGNTSIVMSDELFCLGQNTAFIVPKQNPLYLYYFLNSPLGFNEIESSVSGSTQPTISLKSIRNFDVPVPPFPEQKAIAAVLSSLDDKIDLLHRQNKTLEAMAETLFRQWFIEEAKEDWEEKQLQEVVDIGIGRTPPRNQSEWFSVCQSDIKWISIKDMGKAGVFCFETSEFLTQSAVEQFNIPVIPKDTVVLSFKMTLGRVAITSEIMLSNEAIAHFKFNENTPFSKEYLYLFLRSYKFDLLGSTSSIVTSINSSMIKEIEVIVPDKLSMERFNICVSSFFEKIKANQIQLQTLEKLRDNLLPKLMSGEVRVSYEQQDAA